jgi:nucleotide-binding universal stress UspA family protein
MIETILVPIDISEEEAGATSLSLARDLARRYGSKLVLLNVVEQLPGHVAAQLPKGILEKASTNAVARLEKIARDNGITENSQIAVRQGRPSTEILEYARESGANMIVIASHDPGLADYLLGSVAARVVRHAHCSVLVTRKLEL